MKEQAPPQANAKGPEEVLQEDGLPMKPRRVQNFIKSNQKTKETLMEIEEIEEPSFHVV